MPRAATVVLLLAALLSLAASQGCWRNIDAKITGRPRKRHEACFVMVRGKGYLLGGRGFNGMQVDVYDPKRQTWTRKGSLPVMMHHFQCCALKGKIYIPSSWFGGFPSEQNNPKMWIYDTKRDSWSSRPGLPPNRNRGSGACVIHKKRIYIVCGNRGGHGGPSTSLGWMDYYDLTKNKWVTNLPNMPDPRDHVGGAIVKGKLCIAGGRDGGASNFFSAVRTSTWCYSFKKKKWQNMNAAMPAGRAGSSYGRTCDGKLMVAGGEAGSQSVAFDRVDTFDGKKWGPPSFLQRGRHGSGLAVAKKCNCGQIFITSGSGNRGGSPELESTEVFDPKCNANRICSKY